VRLELGWGAPAGQMVISDIEQMIDEPQNRAQLDANREPDDAPLPAQLLPATGVFGIYPGPLLSHPEHHDDRALVCASELSDELERLHVFRPDRKSTRLNSSHVKISYAVFCLK